MYQNNVTEEQYFKGLPVMLTMKEVTEKTGFPYSTVRRWAKQGKIKYTKIGKRFYINFNSLCDYLNTGDN